MILYFYGNDVAAIRAQVKRVKDAFLQKNPDALNLTEVSAETFDVAQLRQTVESFPFLGNTRLVMMHRMLEEAPKDQLSALHAWLSTAAVPEHAVVLVAEYVAPDTRTKLHAWLSTHARVKEYAVTKSSVQDRCAQALASTRISPSVLNDLVTRLGNDTVKADCVLEQLTLYVSATGAEEITSQLLDLFVDAEITDEIFLLTDALARRDQSEALKRLQRYIEKGSDPYYIHSMLVFQMRTLLLVKESLEDGLTKEAIAKRTGLHPFVVQKTMPLASGFSRKQLMGLFQALIRMEKQFKTSSIDPRVAVDLFVASVTTARTTVARATKSV